MLKIEKEFYRLLDEVGHELDHEKVVAEFSEYSLILGDTQEDYPHIGQEGEKFYNVHEAIEFLKNNDLLTVLE